MSGGRVPDSGSRVLGIDFGGTKMALAVADLSGRVLAREVLPTRAQDGAQQAVARALDCAQGLLAAAHATSVAAAGIATPGAVDGDDIALAPNVPGWEHARLAPELRAQLGVERVGVMNDLNAAALAECRRGLLREADPGLVLGLGTGLAMAVVVNGTVLEGAHHAAGEIGYALTGAGLVGAHEPQLEQVFSGIAFDTLAREHGMAGAADVFAAAAHDERFAGVVAERLAALVRRLVTVCLLVDPQRLVLVGGMTAARPVVEGIRDQLAQILPFPPEVLVSGFPHDAALFGALELAADLV